MYKRQKIILDYILKAPKPPSRTEFFKVVFLLRQETILASDTSFYDFVPYNFGPYSFGLERELDELRRFGFVNGNGLSLSPRLIDEAKHLCTALNPDAREAVDYIVDRYGCLTGNGLTHYVNKQYQWYAHRGKLGNPGGTSPHPEKAIYTAGYEGESIDRFIQKLLKAGIERVIDVRYNPLSRKFGFSKKSLSAICEKFDLEYVHISELGIPPKLRRHLSCYEDYQELLDEYERIILPEVPEARLKAARLMDEKTSVFICFEADVTCCHRTRLAEAITADVGMGIYHL